MMSTDKIHVMRGNCRYSEILYGAIMATTAYPTRMLELGCGIGRNLAMFTHAPRRVGIEPYVYNVLDARKNYPMLHIIHSDHRALTSIADEEFDVAFTCSVLDHIKNWHEPLKQLIRVSKKTVLFEPMVLGEDRQAREDETFRWEDTWYHDYYNFVVANRMHYDLTSFPLYEKNSGPRFKMVTIWK